MGASELSPPGTLVERRRGLSQYPGARKVSGGLAAEMSLSEVFALEELRSLLRGDGSCEKDEPGKKQPGLRSLTQ